MSRTRPSPVARFATDVIRVALVWLVTAVPAPRGAVAAEDRQPSPPRIFFPEPDAVTFEEIKQLINDSFADVNKAPVAREALVHRFGLWSVPQLLERIDRESNGTMVWNAILTVGSLRRALGPSQHLWPAIRVLARVLRSGGEPYRRVFAALALGEFYGPDLIRVGPASREGTEEGARSAREALAKGHDELKAQLSDADALVQTAATLALAKIGGPEALSRLQAFLRGPPAPSAAHWEPQVARLLALGLLQGDDNGAFATATKDADTRVRAGAGLGVATWAVGQVFGEGTELPAKAITRALEYESVLDSVRNTMIGSGRDGAEAIFARGMLAGLSNRFEVWNTVYAVATTPSTEPVAAIAATQALLFAPPQSAARRQIAELIGRTKSGLRFDPSVVAGFLTVAGTDGTPVGVRACHEFLGNKSRDPRGRADWDVRFHAIIGLCRALEMGRIEKPDRTETLEALADARLHLIAGDVGTRTFKTVFDEVLGRSVLAALAADPDLRLSEKVRPRLETAFVDPDVMTADDPIDIVVDRLNDQAWVLFGLDGVKPAAGTSAAGGPRQPNRDDEPQRFLMSWLVHEPYFTRADLHRERGVVPPPPTTAKDSLREIDR